MFKPMKVWHHSERKQPLAVHVVHFLFVTFLWRHMQFRIRNNGVLLIVQLVFFNENSWDIINGKFSYDVISLRGIFLGCHILGKAMQCIAETYSGKFNGINLSFLKNYKATFCKKKMITPCTKAMLEPKQEFQVQ